MPLAGSEATLSTQIQNSIAAVFDIQDTAKLKTVADAIAESVVNHIVANAVVNTTGTTVVASGSSAGTWPTTSSGTVG